MSKKNTNINIEARYNGNGSLSVRVGSRDLEIDLVRSMQRNLGNERAVAQETGMIVSSIIAEQMLLAQRGMHAVASSNMMN